MKNFWKLKIRKEIYLPVLIVLLFGYTIAGFSKSVDVYHVYKVLPAFVIYTDKLDNKDSAITKGPIVIMRPELRDVESIRNHELVHVKQCYRCLFYHWLPMMFNDNQLAKMESEAYAIGITSKDNIPFWAEFIKKEYKLTISTEKIEEYITYYWERQKH